MIQSNSGFSWKVISHDDQSLNYLTTLFNSETNPIACASFGNGDHCIDTRSMAKRNIWGKRAVGDNPDQLCAVARILVDKNDSPIMLFNIGFTGNPYTMTDKTDAEHDKPLYELGVFVADAYRSYTSTSSIAIEAHNMFHNVCGNDSNHSFALMSTTDNSTAVLMAEMDANRLTPSNVYSLLGQNSSHPARFNFNGATKECASNDQNTSVTMNGWFAANPCISWTEKSFFLLPTNHHDHAEVITAAGESRTDSEEL